MRLQKRGIVLLLTVLFSAAATWLPLPFPSTGWKPWVGTTLWESVVFFGYLFLESEFEPVRQFRKKTKHYVVLAVVFLVFGVLGVGFFALFESQEEKAVTPKPNRIPGPLLTSQIEEIKRLQDFIGGKGETELRELFDIPGMMKFNIRLAKSQLAPQATTREEMAETDEFFHEGKGTINISHGYGKIIHTPNGVRYEAVPGKTGLLNFSKKRITNEEILTNFESSAQMPSKIRVALKAFHKALSDNMDVLFDVINEKFAEDPRNLTEAENINSPFYAVIWTEFCNRFIQLQPKRDAVIAEIQEYLRVNE